MLVSGSVGFFKNFSLEGKGALRVACPKRSSLQKSLQPTKFGCREVLSHPILPEWRVYRRFCMLRHVEA